MKRYTIGQQRALVELRALARTARVCRCLADTLRRYDGETLDVGRARIAAALTVERLRATVEAVDARANARRVQAKADKVTAEEALGTLPGVEGRR